MMLLDYNDKRPIYEQIVEKLTGLILRGVYKADEKLPSVRSLAIDLSINPNTIQRAYGELERQGYIYSVKGRGNFVRDSEDLAAREREKLMEELSSLIRRGRELGISEPQLTDIVRESFRGNPAGAERRKEEPDD